MDKLHKKHGIFFLKELLSCLSNQMLWINFNEMPLEKANSVLTHLLKQERKWKQSGASKVENKNFFLSKTKAFRNFYVKLLPARYS